jgi:hypothetical protein
VRLCAREMRKLAVKKDSGYRMRRYFFNYLNRLASKLNNDLK